MPIAKPLRFTSVFTTKFFTLEASEDHPTGTDPYYRMVQQEGALCCPLTPDGDFVMIRQFRVNLGFETIEFPAGGIEAGETALDGMRREMAEETAYRCDLVPLGRCRLLMNRTTNRDYIYLGLNAQPIQGFTQESGIETVIVPRPDFIKLVLADQFDQIPTLGLLQIASLRLGVDVLTADIADIQRKATPFIKNIL